MKLPMKWYTTLEVVRLLGICKRTLYNWEAAGKIPKAKREPMSGYRYWTAEDFKKLRKITGR